MSMIVTGAASGIGAAMAEMAAESGQNLLLVDRDSDRLESLAARIGSAGSAAATCVVDLSDPTAGQIVVDAAVSRFGRVDSVMSNAGVLAGDTLLDLDVAGFDRTFAVNTRATWLLGKAAHPYLRESKGSIVITASLAATHPTPVTGVYSASKAAVLMLIRQMSVEWGPDGIRCNSVSPGPTVSGMTQGVFSDLADDTQRANREMRESYVPLRRLAEAADIARVALFLASGEARHVSGVDIPVDGGQSNMLMTAVGGGSGQRPGGLAGAGS